MHWRQIKEKMRRVVHDVFRVPATRYREGVAPCVVWVRLHDVKETYHGDLQGTSAHMAVVQDQNPMVVSITSHYAPKRGDVLCFREGECYRVDNTHLSDLITTTAEVLPIIEAEELRAYRPPPPSATPPGGVGC